MQYDHEILESPDIWKYVFDALPDLIAILDREHRVVKINKAMADRLGVTPDQGVGLHCYEVVHGTEAPIMGCPHSKLLQDGLGHTSEVQEDNLGGYFLVSASPIFDTDGNVLGSVHIARDITERHIMEQKLQKALNEKEVLLKEVHHRVKNNLMMISSLLNIQSRYIKDQDMKDILQESRNRAKSMALIHQKLYQTDDVNNIEFSEYLRSLATEIRHSYSRSRIELKLDLEHHIVDVDHAIPLGLIATELIINSFKHAFPQGTGVISVRFYKENDSFYMIIQDDGMGFPTDLDFKTQGNMGMNLVNALTDQINGSIDLERDHGTKFILEFKEENY